MIMRMNVACLLLEGEGEGERGGVNLEKGDDQWRRERERRREMKGK